MSWASMRLAAIRRATPRPMFPGSSKKCVPRSRAAGYGLTGDRRHRHKRLDFRASVCETSRYVGAPGCKPCLLRGLPESTTRRLPRRPERRLLLKAVPFVEKGAGHGFAKAQMVSVAEFKHPAHSSFARRHTLTPRR